MVANRGIERLDRGMNFLVFRDETYASDHTIMISIHSSQVVTTD